MLLLLLLDDGSGSFKIFMKNIGYAEDNFEDSIVDNFEDSIVTLGFAQS